MPVLYLDAWPAVSGHDVASLRRRTGPPRFSRAAPDAGCKLGGQLTAASFLAAHPAGALAAAPPLHAANTLHSSVSDSQSDTASRGVGTLSPLQQLTPAADRSRR